MYTPSFANCPATKNFFILEVINIEVSALNDIAFDWDSGWLRSVAGATGPEMVPPATEKVFCVENMTGVTCARDAFS